MSQSSQQSSQLSDPAVRVLIVDDQQLMREGIASLLKIQPGIEIVGTAANGQEALEQAMSQQPDVILMDVRMPVLDGVAATGQIHLQLPTCKILMLTTFNDDAYILEALQVGASGYLLKDLPARDLAQAIQAVHRGIYQLDPSVADRLKVLLSQAQETHDGSQAEGVPSARVAGASVSNPVGLAELTERELDVLRLIAKGATNREIAEELVIGEGSVKNHISNILGRLNLRDRTQAAIYARDHGLL
jgi:DNA-binding NarL/FixJ family response regulator